MTALLLLIPTVVIVAALVLLRDMPRRRQIGLVIFAIIWSCITCGIVGYELGRISSHYREAIAMKKLLRDTDRALEAGQVQEVKTAYGDANRLMQTGGTTDGVVRLIGERLQPTSSP